MLCACTRLVVVVVVGSALGCASAGGNKRVADLRTQLSDLRQQLHRSKQREEDLNNRIFLMQDRLDKQRVAASRVRAKRVAARKSPRPARPARRAAVRPSPPPESAADIARRKAQRRLRVVKLRRGHRLVRRTRRLRRSRRLSRPAKSGKPIVLRLTGAPSAPRAAGRRTRRGKPLGPVPQVSHRLAVVPLPGKGTPSPSVSGGQPLADYRAARAQFTRKKYSEAAKAFSRFTRSNPRHAYADNAQYWLAECFYRTGKVAKAAWVLRKLLKRYPTGNKAPSALLKLALCVRRLGRRAKANKILAQVVQLYPGTREAALAASYLRRRR